MSEPGGGSVVVGGRTPPAVRSTGAGATERLFAAYAVVSAAALAFPQRPSYWAWLLLLHAAGAALLLQPGPLRPAAERAARRWPGTAAFAGGWYALLLVPALYSELAVLNRSVHGGRYFDGLVLGWEAALFGGQPSRSWAAAAPWPVLSELLHGAYLSYYLIIYAPPLVVYLLGRRDAFRRMVFALMLTFFAHYLFFVYFPVQGPRYLFPAPGGAIAEGPLYRLTHWVLEAGSSQGAAFPSSHVAIAVVQTLLVRRYLRPAFPLMAAATAGLAAGTVYGGFHYAVDALAGAALGGVLYLVAPALWRALGGGPAGAGTRAPQSSASPSQGGGRLPASW